VKGIASLLLELEEMLGELPEQGLTTLSGRISTPREFIIGSGVHLDHNLATIRMAANTRLECKKAGCEGNASTCSLTLLPNASGCVYYEYPAIQIKTEMGVDRYSLHLNMGVCPYRKMPYRLSRRELSQHGVTMEPERLREALSDKDIAAAVYAITRKEGRFISEPYIYNRLFLQCRNLYNWGELVTCYCLMQGHETFFTNSGRHPFGATSKVVSVGSWDTVQQYASVGESVLVVMDYSEVQAASLTALGYSEIVIPGIDEMEI